MAAPSSSQQPRRILIASSGVPHESDGASVVLYFHYVDQILRAGHQVHHILLLEGDAWTDEAIAIYRQKMMSRGAFALSTIHASRFTRLHWHGLELDTQVAMQVREHARAFNPDVTLGFDVVPAWALHGAGPRQVVWLGDLIYQVMRWHAHYALRENPTRALHIPRDLLGAWHWRRAYQRALRGAEVIVSSGSSVTELGKIGIASRYEPYPWPADATQPSIAPPPKPTFAFFGTLEGLGSRSAMTLFTQQIYPRLRALWGANGFRILMAGRGKLSADIQAMVTGKAEIEWLGFVPDLNTLLAASHAVLAPIEVPIGNRSRILTALAKGALVIAHKNVALGNPTLVDGMTCALASAPEEFVARMRRAVDDPAWARAVAERGRQSYADQFAPDVAGARLLPYLAG